MAYVEEFKARSMSPTSILPNIFVTSRKCKLAIFYLLVTSGFDPEVDSLNSHVVISGPDGEPMVRQLPNRITIPMIQTSFIHHIQVRIGA